MVDEIGKSIAGERIGLADLSNVPSSQCGLSMNIDARIRSVLELMRELNGLIQHENSY